MWWTSAGSRRGRVLSRSVSPRSFVGSSRWSSGLAGETEVSIDTRKEAVARAAVAAGATIVNDVSATLWKVCADTGAGWVAMHMPADPSVMQRHATYTDVVTEVRDHLLARAAGGPNGGRGARLDRSRDRLR